MQGIQLLPQLVPKQFNTLPTQYRLIELLHEEVWCQKNISWQNNSFVKLANFFLFAFKILFVHIQENQIVPELLLRLSYTLFNNIDILRMCMKKCHAKKMHSCIINLHTFQHGHPGYLGALQKMSRFNDSNCSNKPYFLDSKNDKIRKMMSDFRFTSVEAI